MHGSGSLATDLRPNRSYTHESIHTHVKVSVYISSRRIECTLSILLNALVQGEYLLLML